jgi:hypothetical protein
MWNGPGGMLDDRREFVFPKVDVGSLGPSLRVYVPKYAAAIDFEENEATFEQSPYIFDAGIKALVTGVADGTGTGKIYAYPHGLASANTVSTRTIQGGDNSGAEVMEYAFVDTFKLSGKAGEAWKQTSTWLGRQVAPQAFTGGQVAPTVEEVLMSKTILSIDAGGGTIGATPVTGAILGFEYVEKTGVTPLWTADGNLYFTSLFNAIPEITLKVDFTHDTAAIAEKALWKTTTLRLVRIVASGIAITKGSGVYSYKTAQIDVAGKWSKFEKIGETNGLDIVSATMKVMYSLTDALFSTLTWVNLVTALP